MHVDDAGGRPDPVILGGFGDLLVLAGREVDLPFDAGEIDAPAVSRLGGRGGGGELRQGLPGEGNLHIPRLVGVLGLIQGSVDMHGGLEAGDIPFVEGGSAILVSLHQPEIPTGVQRVHLELVVLVIIPIGIDEHLEVVVLENDRIALGDGPPDVGFDQFCGDVEIGVIPQHFGAGGIFGFGEGSALDVQKLVGPWGSGPSGLVHAAIDHQGSAGLKALVTAGDLGFEFNPFLDGVGMTGRHGQHEGDR
jgi:hypothetical protein